MVQEDPSKRPNMDEVVARYKVIYEGLNAWKLRSRIKSVDEDFWLGIFRGVVHWSRCVQYLLRRLPAIPTYRPVRDVPLGKLGKLPAPRRNRGE